MGLSELTNKELKNILRQNNIKNYSKLNKKDLTKKVNQLIKSQNNAGKKLNGGDNSNTKNTSVPINKKNTPPSTIIPSPESVTELEQTLNVKNVKTNLNKKNTSPSSESAGQSEQNVKNNIIEGTKEIQSNQNVTQVTTKEIPSAPPLSNSEINNLSKKEFNRQTQIAINQSISNQNVKKEECGACTIL